MTTGAAQRLPLSGWGRFPVIDCSISAPRDEREASALYDLFPSLITRGNGRAYGDAAVNGPGVLMTRRLNRMLAFDGETGVLTCESGVSLADIISVFVPRGWFPLVTPGTRFVTVGGLIAADVHGKNHHLVGSFCNHLLWVDLLLPSGEVLRCSTTAHVDLFDATCGGMGLTGTLLRAAFRLQRVETAYILQHVYPGRNLEETFDIFEQTRDRPYSVAWLDGQAKGVSLGRAVTFVGEHLPAASAEQGRASLSLPPPHTRRVPVDFPGFALSRAPVKLFNLAYRWTQRAGVSTLDLYRYFYPLDAVLEWNRIYGRRGFVQYQCALPLGESRAGIARLLKEVVGSGGASFLSTLKRLGPSSRGYLSFPIEGYTLAMDFPANPQNLSLLDRLDRITLEHGGRLYLAKDARASAATITAGYPRIEQLRAVRRDYGLATRVQSHLSQRIGL